MSLPYFSVVDHTIMPNFIENVLFCFESCFSCKTAFNWFLTITIGAILRSDKLGVNSLIQDLAFSQGCYNSMLHFFRVSSWSLNEIANAGSWLSINTLLFIRKGTSMFLWKMGSNSPRKDAVCRNEETVPRV